MALLIDAYAWIEYLEGSQKGEKVRQLLAREDILTLSVTVAEVVSKVARRKGNPKIAYEAILAHAKTMDFSVEEANEAGLLHAQMRRKIPNFGLVDAILMVAAKHHDATIVTGDEHFRSAKKAIFLK